MYELRPAEAADASKICRLHIESIEQLNAKFYQPSQIQAWIMNKKPEVYAATIELGEEKMFVAETGDELVGFGSMAGSEIRAVYVHPRWVLKGIGRQLLKALEEEAQIRGHSRVHLFSSLQAERFYLSSGFRRLRNVNYELKGGTNLEAIEMEKFL